MEEKLDKPQPTQGTTVDFRDSFATEEDIRDAAVSLLSSAKALRNLADRAKLIADDAEKEARKAEASAEMAMLSLIFGDGGEGEEENA